MHRIPPDLHGFYKRVLDALGLINNFVWRVVEVRWDSGLRS